MSNFLKHLVITRSIPSLRTLKANSPRGIGKGSPVVKDSTGASYRLDREYGSGPVPGKVCASCLAPFGRRDKWTRSYSEDGQISIVVHNRCLPNNGRVRGRRRH